MSVCIFSSCPEANDHLLLSGPNWATDLLRTGVVLFSGDQPKHGAPHPNWDKRVANPDGCGVFGYVAVFVLVRISAKLQQPGTFNKGTNTGNPKND